MDDDLIALRNLTYSTFVELGRAPTADEIGARSGWSIEATTQAWRQLHDAHALVLHADGVTLRMANPFSADPTPYRVQASGRDWYGNCAWDAFGIGAALHVDSHVSTVCSDCGVAIEIDIVDGRCSDESLVFHCLVPAARWWDDIAFT